MPLTWCGIKTKIKGRYKIKAMELIIKSEITDITYQSSSKMGFFKQINNVTIVITIAERV